jgi:hypothetical protein
MSGDPFGLGGGGTSSASPVAAPSSTSTDDPFGLGGGTTTPAGDPLQQAADIAKGDRVESEKGNLLHNIMGFGVNAFRDLGDMGAGLAALGGTALHDVRTAIADLNPWEADRQEGYLSDDLADAILGVGAYKDMGSIVLNDYQERYGGFVEGDITEGVNQQFQHPLGLFSDILTVLTAGGYGAAKATDLAARSGMLGTEAAAAVGTTEAGSVLSKLGRRHGVSGGHRRRERPDQGPAHR